MSGDCDVSGASGETFDQSQEAASWFDRLSWIVPLPLDNPNVQSEPDGAIGIGRAPAKLCRQRAAERHAGYRQLFDVREHRRLVFSR